MIVMVQGLDAWMKFKLNYVVLMIINEFVMVIEWKFWGVCMFMMLCIDEWIVIVMGEGRVSLWDVIKGKKGGEQFIWE